MMDRVIPRLVWIERMIRPRYWPFWRRRGDRVIGIIALIMAITVTLPIPLGNWLPAFSTALLGLALSERDGILFALGSAVGWSPWRSSRRSWGLSSPQRLRSLNFLF